MHRPAIAIEMAGAEGRITRYDPPHLLEYSWNEPERRRGPISDTLVRWELEEIGDRVRLTLTHQHLSDAEAVSHAAGWHTFLDRMSACVEGHQPPDLMELYATLQDEYSKIYSSPKDMGLAPMSQRSRLPLGQLDSGDDANGWALASARALQFDVSDAGLNQRRVGALLDITMYRPNEQHRGVSRAWLIWQW